MKTFYIDCILPFITAIHCTSLNLDNSWVLFKKVYEKNYLSIEEETIRRTIWEKNLAEIRKHNIEADLGIYSYYMGMNVFGDLTHEEFKKQFLSSIHIPKGNKIAHQTFVNTKDVKTLPATVDWREKGYVTPVKDQGQNGTCWAFSITGVLEGQQAKVHKKLVSFSEQNLIDCCQSCCKFQCDRDCMINAYKYVIKNGIDTEGSYPCKGVVDKCHCNQTSSINCTGYVEIKSGSEIDLQIAIAEIGPISVGIDASHSSFQLYKSGIYNEPSCSSTQLDFTGLIVGYGSQGNLDYYIFKNSWGTSWGNRGYILMSRNKQNQCGVATMATYPIVI